MTFDARTTVAEIARLHPETLPVFARHRIDLCCGGRHSLEDVARKHGIDLPKLLEELTQALGVTS